MIKKLVSSVIAVQLVLLTFMPIIASADTVDWDNVFLQTVLLEELGYELEANDPLYNDPAFIELAQEVIVFEQQLTELAESSYDLALFDLQSELLLDEISDERFDEYNLTSEDRTYLLESIEAIEDEKSQIGDDILGYFGYGYEYDYGYDDYAWIYAYATEWDYRGGNIVNLQADVNIPSDETVTNITWTQVGGADVTWLQTEQNDHAAFIAPTLREEDDYTYHVQSYSEELTFEVTLQTDQSITSSYVYVYIYEPTDWLDEELTPLYDLYWDVLWRSPDDAGFNYWAEQYKNGLSLEDIRQHFIGSDEYQENQTFYNF